MKKALILLGSIFLVLIVVGAVGIGYTVIRGNALDKESKAYANAAIPAIVQNWNENALLERATPKLKAAILKDTHQRSLHLFETLGSLKKYEPAKGQALMAWTSKAGKATSAKYVAHESFQNGNATITVELIKHGDTWQIAKFNVASPLFLVR